MQVDVEVSAHIGAPVAVVSSYAGDPAHAPEWYANIRSVEWQTEPPVAVGSRMAFVAHFLGRRLAYTYEVVDLVPGERLVMRTSDAPFPMQTSYTWAAEDGGTRMTLRNTGSPSGFGALAAPVMRRAMRAAMTKDLRNLGHVLTERPTGM